jgi:hypothetical protein
MYLDSPEGIPASFGQGKKIPEIFSFPKATLTSIEHPFYPSVAYVIYGTVMSIYL